MTRPFFTKIKTSLSFANTTYNCVGSACNCAVLADKCAERLSTWERLTPFTKHHPIKSPAGRQGLNYIYVTLINGTIY
jgi:hypothetical protein